MARNETADPFCSCLGGGPEALRVVAPVLLDVEAGEPQQETTAEGAAKSCEPWGVLGEV